ncbi:glutathione peroxidase [Aerococcaceae bacterium WGS1372]
MPLPDFSLLYSNGAPYKLNDYNNQVLLIVNTATECGLNNQFVELESLYQDYKSQGFTVIGFPSNQFKQETQPNSSMEESCQLNFGVTFPLNEKVTVNGKDTEPIFQWLKQEKGGLINNDIKWNFTKFLIDRQGKVVKRYPPTTSPNKIRDDIESLLPLSRQ